MSPADIVIQVVVLSAGAFVLTSSLIPLALGAAAQILGRLTAWRAR